MGGAKLLYQWPAKLVEAEFIRRDNRFVAQVKLNGEQVLAHVPNSGRMKELLVKGHRVYLTPTPGEGRVTQYQLTLVEYHGRLVAINSQLPNKLVELMLTNGYLMWLDWEDYRREVTYGHSRLDFKVSDYNDAATYIEVKSVTLVRGGTALFPDAPTDRGRKHVKHLAELVGNGYGGAVIFVVQRTDAALFKPNDGTDPKFADALYHAMHQGVIAKAYQFDVNLCGMNFNKEIPVVV